jgi:hypothetical protein
MLSDLLAWTFCMEYSMGSKPSNNFQSDRPESGGADKDMSREKSGLPDRDKERFAQEQAERREAAPRRHQSSSSIEEESSSEPNPESRED